MKIIAQVVSLESLQKNNILDKQYSQANCLRDCVFVLFLEICNCIPGFNDGTHKICELEETDECSGNVTQYLTNER